MTPPGPRLAIGLLAAAAVPGLLLHAAAGSERLAAGMTAAPFAWPRVLAAHLVTALPLGLIVASCLRSHRPVNELATGAWVAIGLGAVGLVLVAGPGVGESIASSEFGPVVPLMVRTFLAVLVVVPWCVAALAPEVRKPVAYPGLVFGVGLGLAAVPCALYGDAFAAARTEQAADLLGRERLARADVVLAGLCELGSARPVANRTPVELRKALAAHLPRLRQAAGYPLPPNAPPQARLGRAAMLIQLDRLDAAADQLRPLAAGDVTAALLLASVYRDQEKWADSDALFAAVLDQLLPRAATDPDARGGCLTAFEGLAYNARGDGRPADAERALTRGRAELPSEAAFFDFQLGKHHADGGRPHLALEHLRAAAAADPEKYREPAAKLIATVRSTTPACLPRGPS